MYICLFVGNAATILDMLKAETDPNMKQLVDKPFKALSENVRQKAGLPNILNPETQANSQDIIAKINPDALANVQNIPTQMNPDILANIQNIPAQGSQDTLANNQNIPAQVNPDSLANIQNIPTQMNPDTLANIQNIPAQGSQDTLTNSQNIPAQGSPDTLANSQNIPAQGSPNSLINIPPQGIPDSLANSQNVPTEVNPDISASSQNTPTQVLIPGMNFPENNFYDLLNKVGLPSQFFGPTVTSATNIEQIPTRITTESQPGDSLVTISGPSATTGFGINFNGGIADPKPVIQALPAGSVFGPEKILTSGLNVGVPLKFSEPSIQIPVMKETFVSDVKTERYSTAAPNDILTPPAGNGINKPKTDTQQGKNFFTEFLPYFILSNPGVQFLWRRQF